MLNMIYLLTVAIPVNCVKYLLKRRFDLFLAVCKGLVWNLTHFKNIHNSPKI